MAKKTVYLVAYYVCKPKNKYVNTSEKGWMDNADNVAWDEQIGITVKLKNRDVTTAKVILDLSNRTVYRNGWKTDKSFNELFEHFYTGYQKYLDPVIKELGYTMVNTKDITPILTTNSLISNETISSE
jgi:hypothetical protein